MPAVIITGVVHSSVRESDVFVRVPLAGDETPDTVDLRRVPHSLLVPCGAAGAHAVRWTFGGASRLVRPDARLNLSQEELAFIHARFGLGFATVLGDGFSEDDGTQMLLSQSRELEKRAVAAEDAALNERREASAVRARLEGAERRANSLGLENEALKTRIAELEAEVSFLREPPPEPAPPPPEPATTKKK